MRRNAAIQPEAPRKQVNHHTVFCVKNCWLLMVVRLLRDEGDGKAGSTDTMHTKRSTYKDHCGAWTYYADKLGSRTLNLTEIPS